MIDTHTHLFVKEFDEDRESVVNAALSAGVSKMLLPNIDLESIDAVHKMADLFPGSCFPMMGLHPCSVTENWETDLKVIHSWLDKRTYCAIGEIGIDLYWDKSTFEYQREAFKIQVDWAKQRKLPVVIHVREAFQETFELVDQLNDNNLTGVFHCFTGNVEQARHILNYGGFKLGIGGVATFKNGGLDKVLPEIGLEHLVLETDSPYLAPVPHRGKRNESSFLKLVANRVAEIKGVSFEEVDEATTQNALSLFSTVK